MKQKFKQYLPLWAVTLASILAGSQSHGAGVTENLVNSLDAVAMDDFIYGEPQASAIPEPGTILLSFAGLLAGIAFRRRCT